MKEEEEAIQHFIIFCLESYKIHESINGAEALHRFEQYDLFGYLTEGYEVLHTQGQAYILADIEDYIKHHQPQQP
jgi:hypothetical protein